MIRSYGLTIRAKGIPATNDRHANKRFNPQILNLYDQGIFSSQALEHGWCLEIFLS
jgi:hypothetical protein